QVGLLLLRLLGVALVALGGQDGPDLLLEERELVGGRRLGGGRLRVVLLADEALLGLRFLAGRRVGHQNQPGQAAGQDGHPEPRDVGAHQFGPSGQEVIWNRAKAANPSKAATVGSLRISSQLVCPQASNSFHPAKAANYAN